MNARILRRAAVGLAVWGLLAPSTFVSAADPANIQSTPAARPLVQITDVALGAGGMLQGVVVDGSGNGSASVLVTVRQQDRVIAERTTDREGNFVMAGLPGGVFEIATASSQGVFRLWAPGTSPPGAKAVVFVVHDVPVVRGQSRMARFLSRPIVIAGLVATAVAVPVAIHQIEIHQNKSGS